VSIPPGDRLTKGLNTVLLAWETDASRLIKENFVNQQRERKKTGGAPEKGYWSRSWSGSQVRSRP